MSETVLNFGQTTSPPVKHSLGVSNIPSDFYQEVVDKYNEAKVDISNILPDIPNPLPGENDIPMGSLLPNITVNGLSSALSHFTASIHAWYKVSPGNCDTLEDVKITKVNDTWLDLQTGGGAFSDIEVSVSASYEIIGHEPEIEQACKKTEEFENWSRAFNDYLLALNEWNMAVSHLNDNPSAYDYEIVSQGPPKHPGPFTGEMFKQGSKRKKAKFEIYWYLTLTVLKFVYRVHVDTQTHYVSTICCDK